MAAFLASLLTFFSGFGLGTILTPVFALVFPIEIAVAQTAIVHFFNNLFKLTLLGKYMNKKIILHFGIPAILGALGGAYLLLQMAGEEPVFTYFIREKEFFVTPLKLIIALLIFLFSLLELFPKRFSFFPNHLSLLAGGMTSGFFGGLSGHQGALRSAFLIRYNLSKEEYISTGVAIACLIDITRIALYISHFSRFGFSENYLPALIALLSAFAGALLGNQLLKKTTYGFVKALTHALLIIIAAALGMGLI